MAKKGGEKNGGNNKVAPAPAEKKDDVSVTAVYKIDLHCKGCAKKVKKAVRDFDGVEDAKTDSDANKLTVKGTNMDPTAIGEKLEEKFKKKVELVSPQPKNDGGGDKKPEEKKAEKKEEPKKPKEPKKDSGGDKKPEEKKAEKKEEPKNPKEPKKDGGGDKKPEEKKAEKKEEPKKPKEPKKDGGGDKKPEEKKTEKKEEPKKPKEPKKDGGGDKKPEEKKTEKKEEPKKPKEPKKDGGGDKKPEEKKVEKKEEPKKPKVPKKDGGGDKKPEEKKTEKKEEPKEPKEPKKDGGGDKKPEEKKAEKKEEPKKPKEPKKDSNDDKKPEDKKAEKKVEFRKPKEPKRDSGGDKIPTLSFISGENLEKEPPIMELRNQKGGEKNGGNNKVAPAPAEKKDDVSVTAVYKIDLHCKGCAKKVKKAVRDFDGVEDAKTDSDANKLTVKGTNVDPTAIGEKLEEKIKKKVELVSPQPKNDGGGDKKPEEKKAEKKEEPKKPKELRDELHKETPQLARENLEKEPPIMELRNQKGGERNGGDNKDALVLAEKKDNVSITAVYKIDLHCERFAKKVESAVRHFDGVEVVKTDCGAFKLTVKGTNVDPTAIKEKLEEKIKMKVELVSPQPKKDYSGSGGDKKPEEKKAEKKEEPKKPKELRDELHKETTSTCRASQDQQPQPHPQDGSSQSWYPPSVVSSPNSSHPGTPSSASSSSFCSHKTSDRPQSPSRVSPAEAAGIIAVLKDKSVDELRKLLSDKDAYHHFLLSLDQVKIQNNSRDELRKETLQLARENLEKEPWIMELRNQCRIIRTTELAAAQEKLNELERKKEETLKFYSPQSLRQRLQDAMNKTEEESENLHKQLLDRDVDLGTFVKKYKELRTTYHRRALIHLSAKTSSIG
ncbi:hypothetical protein ACB098_09G043100 [Castanea mollissima]